MKNLKEIAIEAMKKFNELNCVLYDITNTGKYAIAGFKSLQDHLCEVHNRTLLKKSRSKAYNNIGEAILPIEIEDDVETFVYLNIAVKTNSPRVPDTSLCKESLLNENGIAPIGMTVLRKNPEDGLYYFAQIDFAYWLKHEQEENLEEIAKDLENIDYDKLYRDVRAVSNTWSGSSEWYIKPTYSRSETCDYVTDFNEEKWFLLENDFRISNAIFSKYLVTDLVDTVIDGVTVPGCSMGDKAFSREWFIFPTKYRHLYKLATENVKLKRQRKAQNAKKGTVQERITKYSELLEPIEIEVKDEDRNDYVYLSRVPLDDTECVALRFFKKRYYNDKVYREAFRIFVENSKLTFAENMDGTWITTRANLGYNFRNFKIASFEDAVLKGTKLEYLKDMIAEIKEVNRFDSDELIEVLCNNLFEIIFSDPALKKIFMRAYKGNANGSYYSTPSLTSVAAKTFGICLNDLIKSGKRVKNLSKKKWFNLSLSQMKKVNAYSEKIIEYIDSHRGDYAEYSRGYSRPEKFNMYCMLSDLSKSSLYSYGYCENEGYSKFDVKVISSLSEKEFDEYLEIIFRLFKSIKTVDFRYVYDFLSCFNSIEGKKKVTETIEKCNGNYSILSDAITMVRSINRHYDRNARLPLLKEGLNTFADIQEWHDELVEIQNQIHFEENRLYALREQERYEKLQKSFEAQQKDWAKYEMTDGEFVIKYPEKASDLSTEGLALHHCVKSFVDKVAEKRTTILFIRKVENPDTPYFTMEVCDGAIRQVHGACNSNIPEGSALETFVNNFADKHGLSHNKSDMNRMLA